MADGRWRMAFACCVLLFAACEKREAPQPSPAANTVSDDDIDFDELGGPNLLSLARGASVVSRTAEQMLEASAVHAIDGDWLTAWRSAPAGPEQTLVFSLPARARIERIGVVVPSQSETPQRVRFEASGDGVAWREITTLAPEPRRDPQLAAVPPFEASYIRVQTLGTQPYFTSIRSVIAKGQELAAPVQPPIEGCWRINGMPARFTRRGTSVAGVIGNDPPMYVLGGTDGRIVRLTWLRGPMWGPAIVTLDPQRRALSGERWHETVRFANSGDGWFGTPLECGSNAAAFPNETEIAAAILKQAGTWTAYGDSALDTIAALIARAPGQRFEIVVPSAAKREAVLARGIRVPIRVAAPQTINETQRVMADGVALHAR